MGPVRQGERRSRGDLGREEYERFSRIAHKAAVEATAGKAAKLIDNAAVEAAEMLVTLARESKSEHVKMKAVKEILDRTVVQEPAEAPPDDDGFVITREQQANIDAGLAASEEERQRVLPGSGAKGSQNIDAQDDGTGSVDGDEAV